MTKEEAKAYYQKLAKESGVSDDEMAPVLKALDNEKFAQGIVPRPEFSRGLDQERAKYQEYERDNKHLREVFYPQAKEAADKANALITKYNQYVSLYGDIDGSAASVQHAAGVTGMTQTEINKLLDAKEQEFNDRLAATQQATLELSKVQSDYRRKFKDELDLDELEKVVNEKRKSGNRDSLTAIYQGWVSQKDNEATPHRYSEESLTKLKKQIADEAVKDFASRNKLPIDSRPKEPHLLFDRAKPKDDAKPNGKSGREAFLEVMNDPEPDTVRQRYPV